MKSSEKHPLAGLWDFLSSLKLTITTLILLAVTSIIGTVIPQGPPPPELLREMSQNTYRLFNALQFFDMYHSWWFLGLLGVFTTNLLCCSIKRLPKVWKTVREPLLVADDSHYRTLANFEEIVVKGQSLEQVRSSLTAVLGNRFAPPVVTEADGQVHFFAQKMAWARFGVYVTHLSIIIIFIGAIIGSVWGYKAYVNIAEGSAADHVVARGKAEPIELGFTVRCDDFTVSFYEGSNRPKDFTSDLVVLENGREVLKKRIEVNDPLVYKGLTFYQANYGPTGQPTFKLRATARDTGEVFVVSGEKGQHVGLPGGYAVAVSDYAPSYDRFGPAVQVHLNTPDGAHGNPFVVLQNYPDFDAQRGDVFSFALLSWEQKYFTGLQVAKDPGVWTVWAGCALLVVGSMIAFFLSHRRVWATIQPVGQHLGIKVGGSAHRNQPAFEIFFDEFKKQLKAEFPS